MMTKAERKIARKNLLARLEPIDPELAKEVREMWAEEEEAAGPRQFRSTREKIVPLSPVTFRPPACSAPPRGDLVPVQRSRGRRKGPQ
jgi:hypothetical protein